MQIDILGKNALAKGETRPKALNVSVHGLIFIILHVMAKTETVI